MRILVLVAVLGLVACRSLGPVSEESCGYDLSREAFVDELRFPEATPRTSRFDDYTPGSYHVDPVDLMEAESDGPSRPVGLFVAGPYGTLWSYEVALVGLDAEGGLRATALVMAHARIAYKAAKWIDPSDFAAFRSSIGAIGLEEGPPSSGDDSGFLAVFWDDGGAKRVFHATGSWYAEAIPENLSRVSELVDDLIQGATTTYATDLPEPRSIYLCGRP